MGQQMSKRLGYHDAQNLNSNSNRSYQAGLNIFNRLVRNRNYGFHRPSPLNNFVDLNLLPPELGIEILKNLNATDLCLASCVWSDLANNEVLWEGLCRASWGYCSAYKTWKKNQQSFKQLFLLLDEGSLTFNTNSEWGIRYLVENDVLKNDPKDLAKFFHYTNQLCWKQVRIFLRERQDILDEVIQLQSFKKQFLPNALRKFFNMVDSSTSRGEHLTFLIEKFSRRFCSDNPELQLTPEIVNILCYSLILLSVDLTSPHVKNKMSKREFIKNICRAIQVRDVRLPQNNQGIVDTDFAGHLYDNVYLIGHVAPQRWDDNR